MTAHVSLAASPSGAWVARKVGARLSLHPATRLADSDAIDLDTDDFDVTFAGPPDQLVLVVRGGGGHGTMTHVLLYNPPDLEVAARAELEAQAHLAGVTGPRISLITGDHRTLTLVRCAPRALVVQPTESGPLVEDAIGLDDNALLVCQAKKIERWDAVLRRPMLRLNLPLPPAPRLLGAAKGNFWAAQAGRDAVWVYRASDGRAFEHRVGGDVVAVASHLASPQLAVATSAGIVRIQAFAHVTTSLGARSAAALAQAVEPPDGEPILYGCDDALALWRVSLADGAPIERQLVATKGRGITISAMDGAPPVSRLVAPMRPTGDAARAWRDELVAWGAAALGRQARPDALSEPAALDDPDVPFDAALSALGDRVAPTARRALALLYAAWLRGAPALPIATFAAVIGGGEDAWGEALAVGGLAAQGWVAVERGQVALVPAVARHLDGAPPRAVRYVGEPPAREAPRGVVVSELSADELVARLGAVAIALSGAPLDDAALEAKLTDAALIVPLAATTARAIAAFADRGGDAIVIVSPGAPLPARLVTLPRWPVAQQPPPASSS